MTNQDTYNQFNKNIIDSYNGFSPQQIQFLKDTGQWNNAYVKGLVDNNGGLLNGVEWNSPDAVLKAGFSLNAQGSNYIDPNHMTDAQIAAKNARADQNNLYANNPTGGSGMNTGYTTPTGTPPTPPSNPFSSTLQQGSTGGDVVALQRMLGITPDGIYGPQTAAAVRAYQQKNGLTVDGIFGPQTSHQLTSVINAGGANPTTTWGGQTINQNAPFDLNTGSASTLNAPTGSISTADVLGQQNSYANTINGYLKQQADAYAALQQTKAQALQGQANIMYGLNGAGGSDANLQGAQQEMFNRNMAFKTLPAQIALDTAQNALALFKQSPAYLNETQARDTAFNLLQKYGDLPVQYNPNISAQDNLNNIRAALPQSAMYRATLQYVGISPITGQPFMMNKGNGGSGGSNGSHLTGSGITITTGLGDTPVANNSKRYDPSVPVTSLPKGVSSTGQPIMDSTAMQVFNGTLAPSEVKGRGLQSDAILSKANDISMKLTGKPYDVIAAQSAYDFRQSNSYQNYMKSAPTAIRNIADMANDAKILNLSSVEQFNGLKINAIAGGYWPSLFTMDSTTRNNMMSAAKDLQSKFSQSQDDIGMLLGTGSGSDFKIKLGGAIFDANGSPYQTQQLKQSVTNTILAKMGDLYRQAGVKDPTPYMSKDMAQIWSNSSLSGLGGNTTTQNSSSGGVNLNSLRSKYNY